MGLNRRYKTLIQKDANDTSMMSESSDAFNTSRFNLFEKENNRNLKNDIL